MISGATGATAIVMVSLVKTGTEMGGEGAGLQYLFATLLLVGLIQILAGVFRFGKFVRLIPHPVMMGFVNGLAIVIFLAWLGTRIGKRKDFWNQLDIAYIDVLVQRVLDHLGVELAHAVGAEGQVDDGVGAAGEVQRALRQRLCSECRDT